MDDRQSVCIFPLYFFFVIVILRLTLTGASRWRAEVVSSNSALLWIELKINFIQYVLVFLVLLGMRV